MAINFAPKKATKEKARLRLGLVGPAGSGKTFTALSIATALVPSGKVLVIDTERGSASKYAGDFDFDVFELSEHSPTNFVECIWGAEDSGYEVVILDSLSHAWNGNGGALEMVDNSAKRGNGHGNNFGAWREVTPIHNQMVDAMIGSKIHVIATLRAKTEHVQERDERTGRTVVRKVGMAPVQRDGLEYEFDVVADLDLDNNFIVGKTRCSKLAGKVINKAGQQVAQILSDWLTDGVEPVTKVEPETAPQAPVAPPAASAAPRSNRSKPPTKPAPTPPAPIPPAAEVASDDLIFAYDRLCELASVWGLSPKVLGSGSLTKTVRTCMKKVDEAIVAKQEEGGFPTLAMRQTEGYKKFVAALTNAKLSFMTPDNLRAFEAACVAQQMLEPDEHCTVMVEEDWANIADFINHGDLHWDALEVVA